MSEAERRRPRRLTNSAGSSLAGPRVCRAVSSQRCSDRWAGSTLGDHLPLSGEMAGLRVLSQEEAPRLTGLDLVFLCTSSHQDDLLAT